jgi:hypothetical protein
MHPAPLPTHKSPKLPLPPAPWFTLRGNNSKVSHDFTQPWRPPLQSVVSQSWDTSIARRGNGGPESLGARGQLSGPREPEDMTYVEYRLAAQLDVLRPEDRFRDERRQLCDA